MLDELSVLMPALAIGECISEIKGAAKFIEDRSRKLFEIMEIACSTENCSNCARGKEPIKAQIILLQQSITTFLNNFELLTSKEGEMQ